MDEHEMDRMAIKIKQSMTNDQICEVEKVTPGIVRQAAGRLSHDKSDPVYSFSSDCFINGTNLLFEHLSAAFRLFLVHGHYSTFLLLATLIPIIKDKLGSISVSKNYRSIAISSLTLKIFDWILLILYGDKLQLDELQFAYQSGCLTTM